MIASPETAGRSEEVNVANFKRRRPKNRRAGCLLCKPQKMNGVPPADTFRVSDLRKLGGRNKRVTRHGPADLHD